MNKSNTWQHEEFTLHNLIKVHVTVCPYIQKLIINMSQDQPHMEANIAVMAHPQESSFSKMRVTNNSKAKPLQCNLQNARGAFILFPT